MFNNNDICNLNKAVWIPDIEKLIASWEEFSESIFCEDPASKQNAKDNANGLRKFLELVESDTLTVQQFRYYRDKYFAY